MFGATMTIQITTTNKPAGEMPVNYGVTDALNSFPLSRAINNITININNNSVSMNMSDILEPFLRLMDPEELAMYEATCPTTLNYISNYRDGVQPYAYSVGNSVGADDIARIRRITAAVDGAESDRTGAGAPATRVQAFHSYPNNVLAYDYGRPAGSSHNHRPRGSFKILRIFGGTLLAPRPVAANDTTVYITFQTFEPLFVSPFIWGDPSNKAGMYGIQNIAANIISLSSNPVMWFLFTSCPYLRLVSLRPSLDDHRTLLSSTERPQAVLLQREEWLH